jgi:RluA family pseudouridine synthase
MSRPHPAPAAPLPPVPPIVFEDAHLLVLDKPAGLPVIRERRRAPSEDRSLLAVLTARFGAGGIFVVHRLDRDTSGVIVFAKDAPTHRRLSIAFERRQVEKRYVAAVQGHLDRDAGTIDAPLREFGSGRVAVDHKGGKNARTRWWRVERLREHDLLEVFPVTGRRHQIRAHLFDLGHPVLGDPLYGRDRPVGGLPRLMLHAAALSLPSPEDGAPAQSFEAPPPPDFAALVAGLRAARA